MKGLEETIPVKNPNQYNGESLHISPHTNQSETTDNEVVKKSKKFYIESYGCQMNFSDSEVVASILSNDDYEITSKPEEASLILLNTCSIRDKAEQRIRKRLKDFNRLKKSNSKIKIGVLGCMAERVKHKFLEEEKIVDIVVGPDSYKDLPDLIEKAENNIEAVNVILSRDETYGDISPVRINSNSVSAFVSITRGCDNMCSFCVVPFTRGRERSRDPNSIINEIYSLQKKGYKELTLLGQNVDSYLWYGGGLKKDFFKASALQKKTCITFDKLLKLIAETFPKIRIRFSTSNPQDMTLEVIKIMVKHDNICKHIHLPFQSGSNRILKKMDRLYTREEYMNLINNIKALIPDCGISHDIITGFPTESEEDHNETLSLMEYVKYDFGYMFSYSERPGTLASRKYNDDINLSTKKRRLREIINLQQKHSYARMKSYIGKTICVLIEKNSKKSNLKWSGRTSQNIVVVFNKKKYKIGDFVDVKIRDCTSGTLLGSATSYSKSI
jgi:tRNA-2-methylthio-N6-dimethylallyladenosine synthase